MFLRSTERKKDGKTHRYFSVVENRRLPGSRTVQRTVLYLGEINDQLDPRPQWGPRVHLAVNIPASLPCRKEVRTV